MMILKWARMVQGILLVSVGIFKPGIAVTQPDTTETLAWENAIYASTPDAMQQFISQFPQSDRLGDAFDLLVQGEIEMTRSVGGSAVRDVQLAQADFSAPEQLELFLPILATEQLEQQFGRAADEIVAEAEPVY